MPCHAAKNPRLRRLDPHRLVQCAAGGADGQGTHPARRRGDPYVARRLSAADLRRRRRSKIRPARKRAQGSSGISWRIAGIFIASPEYNASITPLLKNTLDWVSRVREGGEPPLAAYQERVFALGGASPGALRRHALADGACGRCWRLGCGALVMPEQIAVRDAANAFDDKDNLRDEALGETAQDDRAAAGRCRAADGVRRQDCWQRGTG